MEAVLARRFRGIDLPKTNDPIIDLAIFAPLTYRTSPPLDGSEGVESVVSRAIAPSDSDPVEFGCGNPDRRDRLDGIDERGWFRLDLFEDDLVAVWVTLQDEPGDRPGGREPEHPFGRPFVGRIKVHVMDVGSSVGPASVVDHHEVLFADGLNGLGDGVEGPVLLVAGSRSKPPSALVSGFQTHSGVAHCGPTSESA